MVSHRFFLLALLFGVPAEWTTCCANGGDVPLTKESLLQVMNDAKAFLEQNDTISLDPLSDRIAELEQKLHEIGTQKRNTEKAFIKINAQGRVAVGQQLEHFVGRLEDSHKKTMELNSNIKNNSQLSADGDDEATLEAEEQEEAVEEPQFVPMSNLKRRFETRKVLDPSEEVLREWMQELMDEELVAYKSRILDDGDDEEIEEEEEEEEVDCLSVSDVVQKVQSAIAEYSQDDIGLVDHAQGSEIVHSMTSLTYEAPADFSDLLGNVWWRKYIPEDWEGLLPEGWEQWNVAIPSMFYHSFVSHGKAVWTEEFSVFLKYSDSSPTQNIDGAKVSPPESVVQKKTLPGSCWPMEGSRGQFTIRLPYPVLVDVFSIDHVSSLIVTEDMRDSAPKKLKVIGYPACESDGCAALGFDVHDPMDIGFINYDPKGSDVQTFESVFAQAVRAEPDDELVDEEGLPGFDDEEAKEEGCSAGATICSTPPVVAFSGITVKVLENWGNPDYTCIYRFRLHGNPDYV
jgi:hypothetical protein